MTYSQFDRPVVRAEAELLDATGHPFAPGDLIRTGPSLTGVHDYLDNRDLRVLQIRRLKRSRRDAGIDQLIVADRPHEWFAASHFRPAPRPEPKLESVADSGPWELFELTR